MQCKICKLNELERKEIEYIGEKNLKEAVVYANSLKIDVSTSSIQRHLDKHIPKSETKHQSITKSESTVKPESIVNEQKFTSPTIILNKTRDTINKLLDEYKAGNCPFPKSEIHALCALEKVYITDFKEVLDIDNFDEKRFKKNVVKKLRFLLDLKMTGYAMGRCRFPKEEGILLSTLEKTYANDLSESENKEHYYGPNDQFITIPANTENLNPKEFENYKRFVMMELGLSTTKPTNNIIIMPNKTPDDSDNSPDLPGANEDHGDT